MTRTCASRKRQNVHKYQQQQNQEQELHTHTKHTQDISTKTRSILLEKIEHTKAQAHTLLNKRDDVE